MEQYQYFLLVLWFAFCVVAGFVINRLLLKAWRFFHWRVLGIAPRILDEAIVWRIAAECADERVGKDGDLTAAVPAHERRKLAREDYIQAIRRYITAFYSVR